MWCIDSESGSWNNNGQLKVADAFISEPFQCLRCRDWKSGNWRNYAQLKLTAAFISEPSVMYRLSIWYLTELYTAETDHSFHIGPVGWLTSWCSDPSQPLEILSGLNANFNPCLSYSAHMSLNVNHNLLHRRWNISHRSWQQLSFTTFIGFLSSMIDGSSTLMTKVHTDCFAGGKFKSVVRDPILYTVYTVL